jgi:hypothetical protein
MAWVVAAVLYAGLCVAVPAVILFEGGSVFQVLIALGFLLSTAFRLLIGLGDWRGGPQ